MANDSTAFSLLQLEVPQTPRHRRGKGRPFPRPPEDVNAYVQMMQGAIQSIKSGLADLPPEQKRAVYLKLTTQMDLSTENYTAVGLKPVAWLGKDVTVAITDETKLERFLNGVNAVHTQQASSGVKNAIFNITQKPMLFPLEDRLSKRLAQTLKPLRTQPRIDLVLHVYPMTSDYENINNAVQEAVQELRERIQKAGISAGLAVQDVIHYLGDEFAEVRVRINSDIFNEFLTDPRWNFLLWFDLPSRPDFIVGIPYDADVEDVVKERPPENAPLLCVIDSGLAAGHPLLEPAIYSGSDEPFDPRLPHQYDEVFPAGHGTGVAGIALYYNLEDHWERRVFSPAGFIANARITDHSNSLIDTGDRNENHKLMATLIHKVVGYFAPKGCRIFNLSVCDKDRPFFHDREEAQSLVAATLERLARKYDVLFIVSAGNILPSDATKMHSESPYPKYLMRRDTTNNRILDPAQALTAITVGSICQEERMGLPGRQANRSSLGTPGLLSPFSRTGPGIAGAIKPDLVEVGGNYAWDAVTNEAIVEPRLGIPTLATTFTPDAIHGTAAEPFQKMVGTSVSAPRVSRLALAVLDYLNPQSHPSADLLRAFIVHSAQPLPGVKQWFKDDPDFTGVHQGDWVYLSGYGQPDLDRLFRIDNHRYVAVFDSGSENALPLFHDHNRTQRGSVALFRIPVPTILRQTGYSTKRLAVTLAFRPPVKHSRLRTYAGVRMAWEVFRSDADPTLVWDYMAHSEDDEAPDDKPKLPDKYRLDKRAVFKRQRRSRGTLQHDIIEWKAHNFGNDASELKDFLLAVAVWPNWENMQIDQVQPYALVVSLEIIPSDPRHNVDIYGPVRQRLPIRTIIPVRVPVRV